MEPDPDDRGRHPGDHREDQQGDDQVHEHAGGEDDELHGQPCADERARVVGLVAVLALELHEPADRQPVERVERLALGPQDLRPWREADPELQHPDSGEAGRYEMPELVDEDERAEDEEEQEDRDNALEDLRHERLPIGPVA